MLVILILLTAFISFLNGDYSLTKLIVKTKLVHLQHVEKVLLENNFTRYRKIIDDLYSFARSRSDTYFNDELNITQLRLELYNEVEYLYQSYDLYRESAVAAGNVAGHSPSSTTITPLLVSEDFKECTPVYDPMFGIDDAWQRNITGKGVVIAITDVGVDGDHPKLNKNINKTLSWNFVGNNTMFSPENYRSRQGSTHLTNHGNACAGLAAGSRNTSTNCQPCGCGVAPDASIAVLKAGTVPEKTFDTTKPSSEMNVDSLCYGLAYRGDEIHIYSNSWNFEEPFHKDSCLHDVIKDGYYKGRNCKGNIYVFPADPPGNGLVNNIYTIAVGDMGVNGKLPDDPQANSAALVSMFSSGRRKNDTRLLTDIHTDHLDLTYGLSPCQWTFGGQSATTAMVSGVIALLLEVNPELTAREVKHILVESASHIGIEEASSFKTNGAGKKYHKVFGFGYPNVTKMLLLSKNMTALQPLISHHFNFDIVGKTATVLIRSENITKLEQIEFLVTFEFEKNRSLSMEAISPKHTTSVLFENVKMPTDYNTIQVNLTSNHFWGEDPTGNWTLRVFGRQDTHYATITFVKAEIFLHGTTNATIATFDAENDTLTSCKKPNNVLDSVSSITQPVNFTTYIEGRTNTGIIWQMCIGIGVFVCVALTIVLVKFPTWVNIKMWWTKQCNRF